MDDLNPPFNVIDGGFGKKPPGRLGEIQSPKPPPLANLSTQERRVWDYICEALRQAGIEHVTAGLTIKIICRTYIDWLEAVALCDNGRYELSKNGNPYELPHSYTGGMHPGAKRLEELVYGKRLRHGGNPVLRWAASNVALLFDTNGNFRPDKKKSGENGRIDPIVATVMALSRAAVHVNEQDPEIEVW
ncbi:terminase TerL endonuclease subunit [Andreprevotia chitinilytica]|uniref:terminase TerL endonuclease subunit n=1 Tax=Andreprevotia chitinilytica TaxID=396808 RepID=UPI00068D0C71|nr:terminase TerL endonuclease subunit [Andreprevotia chitinilytica]